MIQNAPFTEGNIVRVEVKNESVDAQVSRCYQNADLKWIVEADVINLSLNATELVQGGPISCFAHMVTFLFKDYEAMISPEREDAA